MATKINPISRQQDIVVQELKGEVLIYDLKTNKAFCLNETSALVWQLCDGNNSINQISQALSKKLNSPASENLVWLAIDQLKKENLIENSDELVSVFTGVTRREAIRKVGLGTMIAIPFISSLIAPTAAMAQSGVVGACASNSCTCTDTSVNKDAICGSCSILTCTVCRKQSAGNSTGGYCSAT
jgi:hypothetical protein